MIKLHYWEYTCCPLKSQDITSHECSNESHCLADATVHTTLMVETDAQSEKVFILDAAKGWSQVWFSELIDYTVVLIISF